MVEPKPWQHARRPLRDRRAPHSREDTGAIRAEATVTGAKKTPSSGIVDRRRHVGQEVVVGAEEVETETPMATAVVEAAVAKVVVTAAGTAAEAMHGGGNGGGEGR